MPWKHLYSTKKAWIFGLLILVFVAGAYGIYDWLDDDDNEKEQLDSAHTHLLTEPSTPTAPSPKPNFASSPEQLNHPPFECRKLYDEICFRPGKKDPTGRSSKTPESEARVLRIFEELVRKYPKELPEEIDERLAKRIYTQERIEKLNRIYSRTQTILKKLLRRLTGPNKEAYEFYSNRIDGLKLELPPPASLYSDERSILTGDDALYYAVDGIPKKIRIGGALVNSIDSKFNLIETLSHEIAHTLSPCALIPTQTPWTFYIKPLQCLGYTKDKVQIECEHPGKMNEILSDWYAAQVVVEIMKEDTTEFSYNEKQEAIKNAVRDLCEADNERSPDPQHDWSKSHPSGADRINGIFAQHQKIQMTLQCDPTKKRMPFRISGQCFKFIDRD